MPCRSPIDAAGALHHVMVKGIERGGTLFRSGRFDWSDPEWNAECYAKRKFTINT